MQPKQLADVIALEELLELPGHTLIRPSMYMGTELVFYMGGELRIITLLYDCAYTRNIDFLPGDWHFQGDYYFLNLR